MTRARAGAWGERNVVFEDFIRVHHSVQVQLWDLDLPVLDFNRHHLLRPVVWSLLVQSLVETKETATARVKDFVSASNAAIELSFNKDQLLCSQCLPGTLSCTLLRNLFEVVFDVMKNVKIVLDGVPPALLLLLAQELLPLLLLNQSLRVAEALLGLPSHQVLRGDLVVEVDQIIVHFPLVLLNIASHHHKDVILVKLVVD